MLTAAVAGIAMYWLQEYAFYQEVALEASAAIPLTLIAGGRVEPMLTEGVEAIDATSSPIRFRACFTTPMSLALLTETYAAYPDAVPLNGPSWFDCFDAAAIGAALEKGEALAFLSEAGVAPDVDRVVAVFADGRAFAWTQVSNAKAE